MRFKRVFAVFVVFVLSLSCVACSGKKVESPETTVSNYLDSLHNLEFDNAKKYVDVLGATDFEEGSDEEVFINNIMSSLDYTIISSTENGDKATVKVNIKNIDMASVMSDVFSQLFSLSFSDLSEEEQDNKVNDITLSSIEKNKTILVENEVDINLEKTETGWIIISDNKLSDAITGGLMSFSNDFGSSSEDKE